MHLSAARNVKLTSMRQLSPSCTNISILIFASKCTGSKIGASDILTCGKMYSQGPAAQERQAVAAAVAEGRVRAVACRGGGHAAAAFPAAARSAAPHHTRSGGRIPSLAGSFESAATAGRHRGARS